jgi:hypothetical protein
MDNVRSFLAGRVDEIIKMIRLDRDYLNWLINDASDEEFKMFYDFLRWYGYLEDLKFEDAYTH